MKNKKEEYEINNIKELKPALVVLSILLVAFAMGNIGLGLGLMFGGKIEVSNLLRIIIISLTYVVAVCIGKFSAIIDKKDKD